MLTNLLASEPREGAGGSVASGRLAYQLDVALCLLLDTHSSGADYLLLFDHHDDVVVCNSSVEPDVAHFYQIKTKASGYWRKADLTQARGRTGAAPPNSYLGKLYHHRVAFGEACGTLTFLSNCPFKLRLTGRPAAEVHTSVACQDLDVSETQFFVDKLKEELGLEDVPDLGQLAHFRQSVLHLDAHEEQARGRLVTFLEGCAPERSLQVPLIFRSLKGELKRRNDTVAPHADFSALAATKGISRKILQTMIDVYLSTSDPAERWRSIRASLEHAGFSFPKIQELRRAYMTLDAELLDAANLVLRECSDAARAVADALPESMVTPQQVLSAIVEGIADVADRYMIDNTTRGALALRAMYP